MPYGMDAFMLGIGMLGKPRDKSRPQRPAVPGSGSEVFLRGAQRRAGRPRAAHPAAGLGTLGERRDLFAITTCPLVAPGKTANLSLLPCDSRRSCLEGAKRWGALTLCSSVHLQRGGV